jgi:hypothetical protein
MAVLEMGYFVAVGSAVSSASREAARFGATWNDSGTLPYLDCPNIILAAKSTSGPLVNEDAFTIQITYEDGTGGTVGGPCATTTDDDLERWDRIQVRVRYTYQPLTPLVGALVGSQVMDSVDRRSIVKPATP